eukprot:scaffold2952_cov312-Pinguiococcus_pyrenoidosus.AAC.20
MHNVRDEVCEEDDVLFQMRAGRGEVVDDSEAEHRRHQLTRHHHVDVVAFPGHALGDDLRTCDPKSNLEKRCNLLQSSLDQLGLRQIGCVSRTGILVPRAEAPKGATSIHRPWTLRLGSPRVPLLDGLAHWVVCDSHDDGRHSLYGIHNEAIRVGGEENHCQGEHDDDEEGLGDVDPRLDSESWAPIHKHQTVAVRGHCDSVVVEAFVDLRLHEHDLRLAIHPANRSPVSPLPCGAPARRGILRQQECVVVITPKGQRVQPHIGGLLVHAEESEAHDAADGTPVQLALFSKLVFGYCAGGVPVLWQPMQVAKAIEDCFLVRVGAVEALLQKRQREDQQQANHQHLCRCQLCQALAHVRGLRVLLLIRLAASAVVRQHRVRGLPGAQRRTLRRTRSRRRGRSVHRL